MIMIENNENTLNTLHAINIDYPTGADMLSGPAATKQSR
jgi:hypothetical protein